MRLGTLLPRAVLVVLVWVLATAAFTFAADQKIVGPSPTASSAPAQAPNLVVPVVTGQVFVFAKGILEDAGFAWRVTGSVHGYPSNRVLTQTPAAGTKVVDTGAPTIVLQLAKGQYAQDGAPEDTSSYTGTRIAFPHAPIVKPKAPVVAPKPKPKAKAKATPKPATTPKPKPTAPAKKKAKPSARPPAFTVPGGRKEPLDEISLPARADRLAAWIATNPKRTNANVGRWLYQHAWIVDGAEFGWWHGSQALEKLITVDRHVERIWAIGHRSEAVARAALHRVRSRTR
jgi:beta-lactam-binding protein with PASTA domain